jgi:hypothetical protein
MGCNLTNSDAGKVVQFPGVGNSKNHTSPGPAAVLLRPQLYNNLIIYIRMYGDLLPSAKTYRLGVQ